MLQVVLLQDLLAALEFLRLRGPTGLCAERGGPSRLLPGPGSTPTSIFGTSFSAEAASAARQFIASAAIRRFVVAALVLDKPLQVIVLPRVPRVPKPADDVGSGKAAFFC